MKRLMLVVLSFMVIFAVVAPSTVDAKRGGYRSSPSTFKKPATNQDSNVSNSNSSTTKSNGAANTQNRGLFSGGSFLKGMMIGGLAGMLFGGMFGGMGMLGDILGFVINLLALFLIIAIGIRIVNYFSQRKRQQKRAD